MVAAKQILAAALFASPAAAHSHLRHDKATEGLIRPLEYNHKLRVCNAYPYSTGLDVFKGENEKLTKETPMSYKSCQQFDAPLKSGDKLEFKLGDASAGSFAVSTLPDNDATLLLVVHRHDTKSTSVSFESHVFGNLASPQVAVIDTYQGKKKSTLKIRDEAPVDKKDKKAAHSAKRAEELRYNSVVGVSKGMYEVDLDDQDDNKVAKSSFVALDDESYVVLRVGVEAANGESFPEEVVVFPQSDPSALPHSAAASTRTGLAGFLMAAAAALFA